MYIFERKGISFSNVSVSLLSANALANEKNQTSLLETFAGIALK
jgi:hypothetical protein